MLIIGAAALIFFGPDQLPKVAKRAGQVVRDVQNTSQSFIREMEKAADDVERREREAAIPPIVPPASHQESAAAAFAPADTPFPAGPLHGVPPAAAEPVAKPDASRSETYEI